MIKKFTVRPLTIFNCLILQIWISKEEKVKICNFQPLKNKGLNVKRHIGLDNSRHTRARQWSKLLKLIWYI